MKIGKGKLILIILAVAVVILAGCSTDKTPAGTNEPIVTGTPKATVTPVPTLAETATPEPTKEPLSADKLGKPQSDSEAVFEDTFEDDMPHGEVLFRFHDGHEIVNEQLYLSTKNGVPVQLADTYSPDVYCEVEGGISQIEYYITFKTSHQHAATSYWMAAFVGIRVYEPKGGDYRPNDPDSGIYMAFTQYNKAVLYHGNHVETGAKWEVGVASIELPRGFEEMETLAIVDTGNKVYYYMQDGESYTLFLTVELTDTKIKAYNAADELIYEADNNLKENTGGYFKVFNHFGNTVIDSVYIKER